MLFLGWDIGGANTKAVTLYTNTKGQVENYESLSVFFPVWQHSLSELPQLLVQIRDQLCKGRYPYSVGVTMTA
ncbi:MAG: hypothetical protein Q6367_012710, partial [Candidatus Freyarchaeota archaeon]